MAFGPRYIENLITSSSSQPILDDERDVPPLSLTTLNPYSKEYQDMVTKALNLKNNSNLTADKEHDLEALVRKYAHIFMLPGATFRETTNILLQQFHIQTNHMKYSGFVHPLLGQQNV